MYIRGEGRQCKFGVEAVEMCKTTFLEGCRTCTFLYEAVQAIFFLYFSRVLFSVPGRRIYQNSHTDRKKPIVKIILSQLHGLHGGRKVILFYDLVCPLEIEW